MTKKLIIGGGRQHADEGDEGGAQFVVYGSRKHLLQLIWEILDAEDVELERQRYLLIVKHMARIFRSGSLDREQAYRFVQKWYAMEEWLYLQLSQPSDQEDEGPEEVEKVREGGAELDTHPRIKNYLAARKRWREILEQIYRAEGSSDMLVFSGGATEEIDMYAVGEHRRAFDVTTIMRGLTYRGRALEQEFDEIWWTQP